MAKRRYNYPEAQVRQFIAEQVGALWVSDEHTTPSFTLEEFVNTVYVSASIPYKYGKELPDELVRSLNRSMSILYDCGCSGKRKTLADAIANMDAHATYRASIAAVDQLLTNITVKATHKITDIIYSNSNKGAK